jgi:hypothetical protein
LKLDRISQTLTLNRPPKRTSHSHRAITPEEAEKTGNFVSGGTITDSRLRMQALFFSIIFSGAQRHYLYNELDICHPPLPNLPRKLLRTFPG